MAAMLLSGGRDGSLDRASGDPSCLVEEGAVESAEDTASDLLRPLLVGGGG